MHKRTFILLNAALATALLAGCGSADEHNAADVTFATDMIPHHRQAIEMAELVDARSDDPEIEQLAAGIRDAQDPEIETMSGWLSDWDEPTPADMAGMDGGMSGMMTKEQMGQLEAATGPAFDDLFLAMMIEHHTGAIEMARTEQRDGQYADATDLAGQIEQGQTAELATMQGLQQG